MRRNIKPGAFPPRRISVQFRFSDLPASKRNWWLVSNTDEVDLCATDPGFEVELYVTTDLRTMGLVWIGELPVRTAIASGRIRLDGSRELMTPFEKWLGLSGFAGIKDGRRMEQRTARNSTAKPGDGSHRVV
jgi:hypothetical protein